MYVLVFPLVVCRARRGDSDMPARSPPRRRRPHPICAVSCVGIFNAPKERGREAKGYFKEFACLFRQAGPIVILTNTSGLLTVYSVLGGRAAADSKHHIRVCIFTGTFLFGACVWGFSCVVSCSSKICVGAIRSVLA